MKTNVLIVIVLALLGHPIEVPANQASQVKEGVNPAKAATMRFGLSGKMGVQPGQRDAVVAILLRDVEKLKDAGCHLYVVSTSDAYPDDVFVYEVWESREAHGASLQLPSVKQAIAEARPMLSGKFEHVELAVAGGLGVPKPR